MPPFEITSGGAPDIADGTYTATLESVTEDTGQYGAFRKWTWLIEAGDEIKSLTTRTSANTGPGSKSYEYLTGLIGKQPQVGERIEDPTGTKVLLQLKKNQKGWPAIEAVLPFTEPQQVLPGVPR